MVLSSIDIASSLHIRWYFYSLWMEIPHTFLPASSPFKMSLIPTQGGTSTNLVVLHVGTSTSRSFEYSAQSVEFSSPPSWRG
jgi:hypothetical protein